MENKFNLTAEVNLQLAKGSGANLIKQLDQVKAELAVNLNQGKVKSAAKKAKQEAEKFLNDITIDIKVGKVDGDPILKTLKKGVAKVLVNFEASNQSIKKWESLFKPKTVDVKMKISESNKKAFLKQFESVFDLKGSGLSVKLKEVVKDAAKSIKRNDIANALEDVVDVKVGPRKSGGTNRKSAAQEIKEYISLLGTYEKAAKAADKAEGRTGAGSTRRKSKFFAQAKKEVDAVAKLLGNEANIAERFNFDGNENSAKDFKNAIDSVYRSLVKLNDLEAKLRSARGKARSTRSIDKNLQQIDQAREDIRANLVNFDVKNPKAFGTNIASILTRISGETGDAIQTFKRDFTDYQRLLAGLRQDKATALAKGLEKEAAILDQLIQKTEQLRKGRRSLNKDTGERTGPYENGRTTSQIKSNQTFQYLNAQVAGFRDVERAARSTNRSVRDTAAAIKSTNIDKTIGGRLVGISGRLDEIVKSYESIQRPEGTKSADFVEELGAKAKDSKRQMGELTDRAKSLNEVLDKLRSQRKFLSLEGLDKQGLAQNSLRSLRNEMAGLIKAGAPIDAIKAKLSDGLINVEAARKDEEAIKRLLINLDKLKITSFQAGQEDYAGVQDRVLRAEKRLASEGQTGARGRNIKSIAAAEIFDIRQADAFNKVVTDGIDKLTKIGARQLTPKGRAVYEQETVSFEKYARNILANTPKIEGALRKVKLARDEFIYGAKLKAQGNFFDQISQAAGLATKRLAAFLIFAQGLYGIQSAITGSIGAAISLQNEFVKFEQILNKQFGGAKLTAELKSLNSEILDLGTNLGVSSAEIAKGAKIFTQAGITGRDLRDVLESITKAELGPTFEGITETAEGSVAIMNQFNIRGKDMEAVLGGINRVAAKFPVESKGIIEGVRRAGGAFSAAGNSIDDFVAAFTVIKSKTRETDESVATAARNLAISLQNAGVQEEIEKITGASLLEDGRFVGITRSIVILGEAVKKLNIQSDDPRFARLVTKIGGKRQFARLLPLIQEYEQLAKISKEFSAGAISLNEDVSVAFESIEVKITKAKESLVQLFTKIVNSDVFKGLVDNFTTLVQLSTAFLQNINSVIGVLAGGLIFRKFSSNIGSGLDYFRSQISGQVGQSPLPGFASGGYIPKDGGTYKDKYHAMLAPGEYIMQGKAVDKYGVAFMEAINSGRLPKSVGGRAEGGLIGKVLGKTGSGIVSGLTKLLVSFGKLSKSVEFAADDIKEFDIIEAIGLKKNKNSQLVTDAIKQVKSGGQLDVVSILRSIGFSGRSGAISSLVSGISRDKSLNSQTGDPLKGAYRNLEKDILLSNKFVTSGSIEQIFSTLSHEVGHAITNSLSVSDQNKLLQAAPREFLAESNKRVQLARAYGVSSYNDEKARRENLADIVRYTVAAKDKGIKDPRLDQIAKILAKSGIGIASDKQTGRLERARVSSLREDIGYGVLNESYFGNRAGVGAFGYGPTGSRGGPPSGGPPPVGGGGLSSGGGGGDRFPTFKKLNTRIGGLSNTFKRLASSLSIYEKIVLGVVAATKLENAIGRETAESTIKLGAAIGSFAFTLTTVTSLLGKFASKQAGGALLNNPVVQGILGNKGLAEARATRTGGIIQSIRGSKPLAGGAVRSDEAKYIAELYRGGGRGANSIGVNSELAQIAQLRKGAPLKSLAQTGTGATEAGFLVKNLGRLAQVAGIAITALDFFANRTKENADKAVLESKSREEALKAFDNGAKGKGASAVTGAASGALLGSLIGSFVPFVGPAFGALIGGSFGYVLKAINGSGIGRLFSLTFSGIATSIKGAFKFFLGAADALDSAVLKLIDVFSGSSLLAEKELAKAVNRFFAGQTGSANRLSALQSSGRTFNKTDFAELISSFIGSTRILNRAGTLPDDIGKQAREQAIGSLGELAQILDKLDVKSQGLVLGLLSEDAELPDDIQKFLNNLGIEFKKKNAQAAIAFDAIDLFLAGISETAAKAAARAVGISDAFARFSPNADRTNPLDSVFENIKDGFNPAKLGLGGNLGNFGAFRRQVGGFDPKLLKGFDFEANLASSSRRLTSSLVGLGGAALNLEGSTPADALGRFLSDAFEKASGGNKIVTEKFNQFIATKTEELGNSVDITTGQINIGNSIKLVEEFVQQFGSKSIEQVQALAKINSDFRSAYSKLFQERLQIEAEVVDSLKKFIDKNKSLEDFQGRISGKTFAELLPDRLANAARRDRNRQSATLVGTGFNGSSSVQDLVKGLLAAQGRARNAGAIARAQVGPNGNLADLNAAEAAIREKAVSDQEKLKAALSAVADGTELAALKMEAFEKAAEKAARSSEFLTNALLGTDEEFLNSARGAVNYQRILGAGDQGQARALLASMSEADRQALGSFIGQDEGTKRKFQEATGIAPAVGQLPEAKAAEEEIKRQIEAQAGLTNALNAQIPQFTQSIAELQKFYLEQFNNSANIIAGFTNQLAVLTGQLTKLPEVIEHKMQGEVVVRIDGGDNLQKAIRDLVASSVNAQVSSAINDLVKANNLNPPRGAGFGNPIPDFAN